jgi:hypothetical protein
MEQEELDKITALMKTLGYELSNTPWSDGKKHPENEEFRQIKIEHYIDSQDGGEIPQAISWGLARAIHHTNLEARYEELKWVDHQIGETGIQWLENRLANLKAELAKEKK